ncbi:acetyl-CoA carboxylase biotin carboxylase subunit [Candidatus Fermentibacteria bacterium]|nr:acetyl-CoA carboxylase biotin carboxylase subunit [Candidatus Fermentibacteria bacterium]
MFEKILIANRGEIAVRVMRACREMGIAAVGVYSEADRSARHVRYADEAYEIGPPPSSQSYLLIDRIIQTAKTAGCQAIHPGYGFLAENPDLASACESEGIVFIGPNSAAMELVGDKTKARSTIEKAGIPIIPGVKEPLSDPEVAVSEAEKVGYPIMLKAAGGGGGKGVRIVNRTEEMADALERARSEAMSSFGNPDIYLEKYVVKPRHVEIQILADNHGNVIHLNERECSIQRRYQKLIEESPSCALNEELRRAMGEAAVKSAKASGYSNAGTVEFLVDADRNFYFLEVNARLQVEHPVTELITGIDLVKQQVRISAGEKLEISQDEIGINGAAIECRICAEDPRTFFPSTGIIEELVEPAGPGVRIESGIHAGFEVSVYYDPLIAKLITWGQNREEAVARMQRALEEYKIKGIQTTIPFHQKALVYKPFLEGNYDTSTVTEIEHEQTEQHIEIGAIAATMVAMDEETVGFQTGAEECDNWKMTGRLNYGLHRLNW